MSKITAARLKALKILQLIRQRNAYAHDLIEKELRKSNLVAEEQGFAELLIKGVVATLGELDYLLSLAHEKGRLKPKVRDALRISLYELYFLDKEPHIVVSQGVELVRSFEPYGTGFANKVLRNAVRIKEDFPFGNPSYDLQALAHKEAFPVWLSERLVLDLGFEQAAEFMAASNKPAPLFLADLATGNTMQDKPSSLPKYLSRIEAGELIVADASAQAVAALATPLAHREALPFLEIGSGRGTKTVLLAHNARREAQRKAGEQSFVIAGEQHFVTSKLQPDNKTREQPLIYALDLHSFKQNILEERCKQYQIKNVLPTTGDATKLDELAASGLLPCEFSGVLIDAPCSGTGTMRRNPEIRWRLEPNAVSSMATLGLNMLNAAAAHVVSGGYIVYSTCSVLKEENEQVVERFLNSSNGRDFSLKRSDAEHQSDGYFRSMLSTGTADAHFAAKLVKSW